MPSVVRLSFNCIRMTARIDVRYIHNGRGHKKSLLRIYLAYVITYAAAKVLQNFDIRKKNRRKKTHYLLRRCVPTYNLYHMKNVKYNSISGYLYLL